MTIRSTNFCIPAFGLVLVLSVLLLLTGCAPAASPAPAGSEPAAAPTAAQTPTQAPTAAPTATQLPTEAPTAAQAPTEAPTATSEPTNTPAPTVAPTDTPAPVAAITFSGDVRPLLERRCINCHGGKDGIKGGLSLRSYADLMKGGESGAVIVAGDPANSLLVELITTGEMPKRAPKLPQEEIDLISAWVAAGAKND